MKTKINYFSKLLLFLLAFSLFSIYAKCSEVSSSSNPIKIIKKNFFNIKDGNDVIILKDGTEINCTVIEISETEVKYKRADNPNGPTITISKSNIFKINYSNGTSDFFGNKNIQNNQNVNSNYNNLDKDNIRRKANNSLLFAIVSFFIPYLGILVAWVAINQGLSVLRMTEADKIQYSSERSTANIAIGIATSTILIILTATILLLVI